MLPWPRLRVAPVRAPRELVKARGKAPRRKARRHEARGGVKEEAELGGAGGESGGVGVGAELRKGG